MVIYILLGFVTLVVVFVLFMFNFVFPRLSQGGGEPVDIRNAVENGKELFNHGGSIVVVVAHPDDAEYYCGGTVARLARSGHKAVIVVCTTKAGDKGKIRKKEQGKAASILGYQKVVFLNYPDGSLKVGHKLVSELEAVYEKEKPKMLFTFDSIKEGRWYHHPDHKAAGKAALKAAKDHKFSGIYLFHSSSSNTWAELSEEDLELKNRAFLQHKSQRPLGLPLAGNHLKRLAEGEGKLVGLKYAEVFRKP